MVLFQSQGYQISDRFPPNSPLPPHHHHLCPNCYNLLLVLFQFQGFQISVRFPSSSSSRDHCHNLAIHRNQHNITRRLFDCMKSQKIIYGLFSRQTKPKRWGLLWRSSQWVWRLQLWWGNFVWWWSYDGLHDDRMMPALDNFKKKECHKFPKQDVQDDVDGPSRESPNSISKVR